MPESVTFSLDGQTRTVTKQQVDKALSEISQGNGDIQVWAVQTDDGRRVPLKALFRLASGIQDFTSQRAKSVLVRLGYRVLDVTVEGSGPTKPPPAEVPPRVPLGPSAGTTDIEPPASNGRLGILRAAIEYASTRPDLSPSDVGDAATVFERWLAR